MSLILVVIWPLLLAMLLALPNLRARAGWLAPAGILPALLLWLAGPQDASIALPGVLTGVTLALDSAGRVLLALTSLAWLVASVFVWRDGSRSQARGAQRVLFWLLTMTGNLLWVLAGDAVSFYLGFTLMSLAAWGLVVDSGKPEALRAGRVYLVMALAGEMAILAGLIRRVADAGAADFGTLAGTPVDAATVVLLFVGFGIKVGVPMLHMWLPLAHPAAPVPASAVLSGVMLKAGVLGWLRFLPGELPMPEWGMAFVAAGVFAMFFGVVVGLAQSRPKTILAYSSISQMGWLTAGVGLWLAADGGAGMLLMAILLFALHHGLAKSALFLGVGLSMHTRHPVLLRGLLWLPALALAAMPMTSGMLAKSVLKEQLFVGGPWLELLLIVAGMGTFWLMLHFFRQLPRPIPAAARDDPWTLGSWAMLILLGQGLLWWWPKPDLVWGQLEPGKLLQSLWPAALALLVYLVLHRLRRLPVHWLPAWPEGDVLVVFDRVWHVLGRIFASLGQRFDTGQARLWNAVRDCTRWLCAWMHRLLAQEGRLRLWRHFVVLWAGMVLLLAVLIWSG
ncbi:MAG: complex I subunit 5 family protein [Halothiobacillaceae bacterium]